MQCGSSHRARPQRSATAVFPRLPRSVNRLAPRSSKCRAAEWRGKNRGRVAPSVGRGCLPRRPSLSPGQRSSPLHESCSAGARSQSLFGPAVNRPRLSWIARSDSVSSALVASSKIKIGGIVVDRPRDRDALLLTAGKREARFADLRFVAQGQAHDEIVRAGRLRRGQDAIEIGLRRHRKRCCARSFR